VSLELHPYDKQGKLFYLVILSFDVEISMLWGESMLCILQNQHQAGHVSFFVPMRYFIVLNFLETHRKFFLWEINYVSSIHIHNLSYFSQGNSFLLIIFPVYFSSLEIYDKLLSEFHLSALIKIIINVVVRS
jgi:hypothetical protein